MDHVSRPIDAIVGHVIPGVLFVVWGLWWFRRAKRGETPFGARGEVWLICSAVAIGVVVELSWRGWMLSDHSVMNFQHATMYVGFAIPAIMSALVRRGRVSERMPYVTLAAAFSIAGALFIAHGNPNTVSEAVHVLMGLNFFAAAIVSGMEAWGPSTAARALARSWLTIAVGAWFLIAAYVLGAADYDLNSVAVVLRVRLFFIWDLAVTGLLSIALHSRRQTPVTV